MIAHIQDGKPYLAGDVVSGTITATFKKDVKVWGYKFSISLCDFILGKLCDIQCLGGHSHQVHNTYITCKRRESKTPTS